MSVLPIRLFGDPVLTTPADPVLTFDAELRRLVGDLHDTLYDEQGSGLAAPQLGVGLRVFAFDVDGPEGCLSMPGIYVDTIRRQNVVARGCTDRGDPVQIVGSGYLARCLQHETDHLDGVLFIDRMDTPRRRAALRALREAPWAQDGVPRVKISPHAAPNPFR
jgi:peptide deformylase